MEVNPLHDFRNFLYVAWQCLKIEPTPLQYEAADWLQKAGDRRMLSAHRNFGKTYLLAAYCCWLMYMDPDTLILNISKNERKARDFLRLVRRIIGLTPALSHLVPVKGEHIDGADGFECGAKTRPDKDLTIAAYGMTSMVTGTHVDHIVPDDIETMENSRTVDQRHVLLEKCKEFEDILNPGGTITFLGTPQTEESIYITLATHYKLIRIPSEFPDPTDEAACDRVAPFILDKVEANTNLVGRPTNPERFPEEILLEKRAIQGESRYRLQWLLDTTLSDADRYPLKLRDLIVLPFQGGMVPRRVSWGPKTRISDIKAVGLGIDGFYEPMFVDDQWEEAKGAIMYVDPAGSGADETGYAVGVAHNGMIYIPIAGGLDGGHDDVALKKLAQIARDYGVIKIVVESNFGDGMYEKLLMPVVRSICEHQVAVESEKVSGQKELRIIDTLEPAMNQHRIVIHPRVAMDTVLQYQMTRLTKTRNCLRHDDRVEAVCGVVRQLMDIVAKDPNKVVLDAEHRKALEAAREFERTWKNPGGRKVVTGISAAEQALEVKPRKRRKAKWSIW